MSLFHRRTQDFTMEGFHVVGAGPQSLGREVSNGVHGQSPGRGSGNPEAVAKC